MRGAAAGGARGGVLVLYKIRNNAALGNNTECTEYTQYSDTGAADVLRGSVKCRRWRDGLRVAAGGELVRATAQLARRQQPTNGHIHSPGDVRHR